MTDPDFLYSQKAFIQGIPEHIEAEIQNKFRDATHCGETPNIYHVDDLVFSDRVRRIVTFACSKCKRTFCESYVLKKSLEEG